MMIGGDKGRAGRIWMLYKGATVSGGLNTLLADEPLCLQPVQGNLASALTLDVDLTVELVELLVSQGERDRFHDLQQVGVALVNGLANGERGVVDREEMLVVVKEGQAELADPLVGGGGFRENAGAALGRTAVEVSLGDDGKTVRRDGEA